MTDRNEGQKPWFYRRKKLEQRMTISVGCLIGGAVGATFLSMPESVAMALIGGAFTMLAADAVNYTIHATKEDRAP